MLVCTLALRYPIRWFLVPGKGAFLLLLQKPVTRDSPGVAEDSMEEMMGFHQWLSDLFRDFGVQLFAGLGGWL